MDPRPASVEDGYVGPKKPYSEIYGNHYRYPPRASQKGALLVEYHTPQLRHAQEEELASEKRGKWIIHYINKRCG
jgi:hypothetical protein